MSADIAFVLDASAMLAFLNAEPGTARVEDVLLDGRAAASCVNVAETLSKLVEWGVPETDLMARLDALNLTMIEYDRVQAQATAELRRTTRPLGLSLGDRACLALARQLNATALTADRPWTQLDLGIAVECIR